MRVPAVLFAIALLAAGCVGGGSAPAATSPPDPTPTPDPPAPLPPAPTTFLMALDGRLFEGDPEGSQPQEFPMASFHALLLGSPLAVYLAESLPLPGALVVESATLTAFLRHEGGSIDTSDAFGLPGPIAAALVSGAGGGEISFYPGAPLSAPSAQQELRAALPVPSGGLVIPAGAVLGFGTAAFYTHPGEAAPVTLLMNGPSALSRIDLTTRWTVLPELGNETVVLSTQGSFPGSGCGDGAVEGESMFVHPFEVPRDAVAVLLEATAPGGADVDLHVRGPSGRAASNLPESPEVLWLFEPNVQAMGTGEWRVEVHNCAEAGTTYTVQVSTFVAAPPMGRDE